VTAVPAALLTYSAQVLILIAAAALAALAVRLSLPAARLHYWRAIVVLCLLLPAVPGLPDSGRAATVTFELGAGSASAAAAPSESWSSPMAAMLLPIVAAGIVARLLWLALGAVRLRQLRRRSRAVTLTPDLEELRASVAPRAYSRE